MLNTARESLRQSAQVKRRAMELTAPLVEEAARLLGECLKADGRGFIIGNGGSAADAQHFAAEFTGRFSTSRRPLPVMALTTDTSALTCIGNDFGFDHVYARQIEALGRPGDVLFALSTSGTSKNIVMAAQAARERGVTVIGMTGQAGGPLGAASDLLIEVPSPMTARIQECQMTMLHIICDLTEQHLGLRSVPIPEQATIGIPDELISLRSEWRHHGLKVVSTNGCFDVLHAGHLQSLTAAAALGDVLVVLLNSDSSVRRLKGPARPVNSEPARTALLAALQPVDYVYTFEEADPSRLLSFLQPDIHCKGEEYADGLLPVPEAEVVERAGGRMHYLPRVLDLSSTAILDRLEVVGVDE